MNRNAYEVLDISPIASDEEIRKQYHTLIRRVHNDKEKSVKRKYENIMMLMIS